MSTTHNDSSSQSGLRVGLIADAERLEMLAPAARACSLLKMIGQAGMAQAAGLPDVPWFDDRRVLLEHPELQAVLLVTSTRRDAELGARAIERGLHVWRLPPLARNFAEATEIAADAKRAATVYRVASWWEHVANHVWQELDWPDNFQPLFSELRIDTRGPGIQSWRASLVEAAGGVLANDGYALLEALVAVRGLPESVSAAVGNYRRPPGEAACETEDTALAIMRYSGGGTAMVQATWDLPSSDHHLNHRALSGETEGPRASARAALPLPSRREIAPGYLEHHGQDATVKLTDEEALVIAADGTVR
ncbi:MAG: hypothetical protein KAY37_18065, partial [Phycisphaerae bacterium]|nr:hypothetical protein [Phycisphaerae bacterium]